MRTTLRANANQANEAPRDNGAGMDANMSSQYLSVDLAGERVGVSGRTVRRWIAAGYLKGYRIGPKLLRVKVAELDAMASGEPVGAAA